MIFVNHNLVTKVALLNQELNEVLEVATLVISVADIFMVFAELVWIPHIRINVESWKIQEPSSFFDLVEDGLWCG